MYLSFSPLPTQEAEAAATPVKADQAPEAANGADEAVTGGTSEKKKKKKVPAAPTAPANNTPSACATNLTI